MPKQPAAYIQAEIYEDSVNLLGVARVKLPTINYPTVNISGTGMTGNLEVPLIGMVDNMTMEIDWLSHTGDAVRLASPEKHQLDIRVVEEYWDTDETDVGTWGNKYVVIARAKSYDPGSVAPMANADAKSEYVVYYFAGYRDGQQLFEVDKRHMKCVINGKDYMADVRKKLGK